MATCSPSSFLLVVDTSSILLASVKFPELCYVDNEKQISLYLASLSLLQYATMYSCDYKLLAMFLKGSHLLEL